MLALFRLTANAMKGDAEGCYDACMDAFLTKPLTVDALHEALSKWLAARPAEPV